MAICLGQNGHLAYTDIYIHDLQYSLKQKKIFWLVTNELHNNHKANSVQCIWAFETLVFIFSIKALHNETSRYKEIISLWLTKKYGEKFL